MRTGYVALDQLPAVWPVVAPMLASALDVSGGRYALDQTLADLLAGKYTMWLAHDDNIHGVALVEIIDYAGGARAACIFAVAGRNMTAWGADLLSTVEAHAKANGCTLIEASGRKGWMRLAAKHGYRAPTVFLEKRI